MVTNMRIIGVACLAFFGANTAVSASELTALAGESVHLGAVTGTVYYTEQADGFQVVTTLASGEHASPLRVVVTLQPGQRQIVSVPRGVGEPALEVEITHAGDHINVIRGSKLAAVSE